METGKRAAPSRRADFTRAFLKDWERLSCSGRFDLARMKEAMLLLIANDGPLPAQSMDHPLKGTLSAFRECHIGGDFLLMYRLEEGAPGLVVFVRAGTHAALFES